MKTMLLLVSIGILLQLIDTGVSGATCPQAESIKPCTCNYDRFATDAINIHCEIINVEKIKEVTPALKGMKIEKFVLYKVEGGRLPSDLFSNIHVRVMDIRQCDFEGLSDSEDTPPFVGLEESLEVLEVVNTIKGSNSINKLDLSHLKNLKELYLHSNSIPELGNDWFANGPFSLKEVTIYDCGVQKLGDRAFEKLTNLRRLWLVKNPLKSGLRTMVPNPAPNLNALNFAYSGLPEIPENAFEGMPSLRTINLEGNSISRMPWTTWKQVWDNKWLTINLKDNPLECDDHIEWMFSVKRPTIMATCASPEERKGHKLDDLIDKNKKPIV